MSANRQLFVNTGAVEAADSNATDPSLVADGKFAILDQEDLASGTQDLTTQNDGEKFTLVRGGSEPLVDHIEKSKIKAVRVQDYRAEVQQVTSIGFDGTSGSLSDAEGEGTIKFVDVTDGFEPFPRVSASVNVKDADLPYDIAVDLINQINGSNEAFVNLDIRSDVTTSSVQDSTPSNITATVTNGSKNVVFSADPANVSAGQTLRIGTATTDTSPVYKVVSVSGNTVVIDRPYKGESDSGVSAGVGAAPAEGDAVGLIATGKLSKDGEPATSFQTSADGIFAGINISAEQDPVTATGSYAQMKNLEEFSWGNRSFYMTNYFPQTPESDLTAGETYDLAVIEYENNNDDAVISQNETRQIYVAFPSSTAGADNIKTFFGI